MNNKKSMFFIVAIVFFLMISAISAQEDTNSTISEVSTAMDDNIEQPLGVASEKVNESSQLQSISVEDNDVNEVQSNSLTDLQRDIDDSTGLLELEHDYTVDTTVTITKNGFVIDGKNHKVDGNGNVQIFSITGKNVIIKNLVLANGNSSESGGAINNGGSGLLLINSTFINNNANKYGGAISSSVSKISFVNCSFLNNTAGEGGAISIVGNDVSIEGCSFTNNSVKYRGGAIYHAYANLSVVNCSFLNNTAGSVGGGIFHHGMYGISIVNSSFVKNNAGADASAIEFSHCSDFSVVNCTFVNNTQDSIRCSETENNFSVVNCTFINNTCAIYISSGVDYLISNSVFINNTNFYGPSAVLSYATNLHVVNCSFTNNLVNKNNNGIFGTVNNAGDNLAVINCSFTNNVVANGAGAIVDSANNAYVTGSSFVNNTSKRNSYCAISTSNDFVANDNWWGNNTPNWDKLFLGNVVHDTFAVLNLTVNIDGNKGMLYLNFYKNGTTTPVDIYPREVNLTIGDDVSKGTIVNSAFEREFQPPSKWYDIIAIVDNQNLNITFNNRSDLELKVTINNITYGDDLVIDANINSKITDDVTIIVDNNKNYATNMVDGKIHYSISNLSAGNHNITIKYNGNDDYNPIEYDKIINVAQATATLEVNIDNVTYGEASIINIKLTGVKNTKLNGNVVVTINNKDYKLKIENGQGTSSEVKLPANKNYEFKAIWNENIPRNLRFFG